MYITVGQWRWGKGAAAHVVQTDSRTPIGETTIKNARMGNASGSVTKSKDPELACSEGETVNT